jgi:hypothetical protein
VQGSRRVVPSVAKGKAVAVSWVLPTNRQTCYVDGLPAKIVWNLDWDSYVISWERTQTRMDQDLKRRQGQMSREVHDAAATTVPAPTRHGSSLSGERGCPIDLASDGPGIHSRKSAVADANEDVFNEASPSIWLRAARIGAGREWPADRRGRCRGTEQRSGAGCHRGVDLVLRAALWQARRAQSGLAGRNGE